MRTGVTALSFNGKLLRLGVVLALAVGNLVIASLPANAASFTVRSVADTADASPGDGLCEDGSGDCTLRAAIEEVNALGGSGHTISFSIPGPAPHTISPGSALPPIVAGVSIDATPSQGPVLCRESLSMAVLPDRLTGSLQPGVTSPSSASRFRTSATPEWTSPASM